MPKALDAHLKALKTALTSLKPTGHEGFEGLLAAIFSAITSHSFRLAGSGSQHGKDGSGTVAAGEIAFEAKLYTGSIDKNQVLAKVAEIIASDPMPDLWVLGATIEIKTQLADTLRKATSKNGINILMLDWPKTAALPELAVLCAIASEETVAFLERHVDNPAKVAAATKALAAIGGHAAFDANAGEILAFLHNPGLGLSIAEEANASWLTSALSDPRRARKEFGQSLVPLAESPLPAVSRDELLSEVKSATFGPPRDEVVVLLGDEGCGKSWIFAQGWIATENAPLTLIIPASEIPDGLSITNEQDFLVQQIIRQTGGVSDERMIARWRHSLSHWSSMETPSHPNIVVFVDGLNQRPSYAWPTWLDSMAYQLSQIGGQLVISVRNGYFDTRLRGALTTPANIIPVKEWTETELLDILLEREVPTANLSAKVIATLRNPRVLGIAFDLLKEGSIKDFDELSVDRLLFEHIRKSTRHKDVSEGPLVFTKRLSSHASDVLQRVKNQGANDKLIFESADLRSDRTHTLSQDLLAVSEGRFFNPLPEDPYLYELTEDGLNLALGFAILDSMRHGNRNGTDVSEMLNAMLEPIAALDKTSEAVFAALLISSLDERSNEVVTTALIIEYLKLQNIDENTFPAFEAIVRNQVDAAMGALAELAVSNMHVTNADWLTHALRELRCHPNIWVVISKHINAWLRLYSLDPKISVFENSAESNEKYKAKLAERERLLKARMDELSDAEAQFLSANMHRDDRFGDGSLDNEVFSLLAGMQVSDFSESLVACAFSQALNSSFHRRDDQFLNLIRFNSADWAETRTELLRHAAPFAQPETSNPGKWAYVQILRATSTVDDAVRCQELVDELTRNRETFEGFRLMEKYCETDPCDPSSDRPDSIASTAKDYRNVELKNVRIALGMTQEDHFLQDASFGLARFEPGAAIEMQRRVIEHFSKNAERSKRHQLLGLRDKAALVTDPAKIALLELATARSRPYVEDDKESRDDWLLAQNALLLAFPHMDGNEQLEALLSLPSYGPPLLDLADNLKPASALGLEQALDRCVQSNDANFKMTILMVARYSDSEISSRSVEILRSLTNDSKSAVRALAIGTLTNLADQDFLSSFVERGWNANALDTRKEHFERWDGAKAIATAYANGLLQELEAVERISVEHYHLLASKNPTGDFSEIPRRLNASVAKMLDVDLPIAGPVVEQNSVERRKGFAAPLKSIVEPEKTLGPKEFFQRMSETEDEFDARQKRGHDAFDEFEATLTKHQARQIIDDTPQITLKVCAENEPEMVRSWADSFLAQSGQKIRHIYNFGLRVAETLSHTDAELSARLFHHLRDNRGFVNIVHGPASLGLESLSIWRSVDNAAIDILRAQRLDEASSDHEISQEVLAAHSTGSDDFLSGYIEKKLACEEPANIARALMVCGFALANEDRERVIAAHAELPGMIGDAAKAARYAYERNIWARHWYEKMLAARSNEDFWRFSVLFLKVVDGRYQCWTVPSAKSGTPMHNFEPSTWREVERRIKKWQDKRSKKLFGADAPAAIFLSSK